VLGASPKRNFFRARPGAARAATTFERETPGSNAPEPYAPPTGRAQGSGEFALSTTAAARRLDRLLQFAERMQPISTCTRNRDPSERYPAPHFARDTHTRRRTT
jgi:hypothetical protein